MSSSTNVVSLPTGDVNSRTGMAVSFKSAGKSVATAILGIHFYQFVSLFLVAVGLTLLATSLTHLAHGVHRITGDTPALAWCLAIGIDLAIIGLKLATIAGEKRPVWKEIGGTVRFFLILSLAASAGLNILSYTEGKTFTQFHFWLCVFFGLFLPSMIWALSHVSAKLWIYGGNTNKKSTRRSRASRKRKGSGSRSVTPEPESVQMSG